MSRPYPYPRIIQVIHTTFKTLGLDSEGNLYKLNEPPEHSDMNHQWIMLVDNAYDRLIETDDGPKVMLRPCESIEVIENEKR